MSERGRVADRLAWYKEEYNRLVRQYEESTAKFAAEEARQRKVMMEWVDEMNAPLAAFVATAKGDNP